MTAKVMIPCAAAVCALAAPSPLVGDDAADRTGGRVGVCVTVRIGGARHDGPGRSGQGCATPSPTTPAPPGALATPSPPASRPAPPAKSPRRPAGAAGTAPAGPRTSSPPPDQRPHRTAPPAPPRTRPEPPAGNAGTAPVLPPPVLPAAETRRTPRHGVNGSLVLLIVALVGCAAIAILITRDPARERNGRT